MRRPLILAAAALWLAGCGGAEPEPLGPARAAEPQQAELGWRESYPATGEGLVFVVDELRVRAEGWSVDVAVTNSTRISFETAAAGINSAFGLMLFGTGDLAELEDAARAGGLPPVRRADTIEPQPPQVLAPNETWRATLSAPGSLADGSFVRVSFGPFRAEGDPPAGMEPVVVWITDRAHRL
jgi:hypothetical protein